MTLLEGEHVSTDLAVRAGRVVWLRHSLGTAAAGGTFDYWTIEAAALAPLEGYLGAWARQHLATLPFLPNTRSIRQRAASASAPADTALGRPLGLACLHSTSRALPLS